MSTVTYRDFTGTGAENYQRYFVPAIATPVSVDLLATAALTRGDRVLDVACGTGLISRLAAERVGPTGSVTGLDIAPDMIDVARRVQAPTAPVIQWREGDAAALPFDDDSYDVVLCQMGLMFMEDRVAAVREMGRVLAPGGRLVVNTPGSMHHTFEVMEQAIAQHIAPELGGFVRAVFSMPDPDAVAGLLRDAGLDHVTSTTSIANLRLPAPADFLWQYISVTPIGPQVEAAPEAAKAAMERQVVAGWQTYAVDGGTHADQPMVVAKGHKDAHHRA